MERDQSKHEKMAAEKRLEEIIRELNEKIMKEKATVIDSVEVEIRNLANIVI
jgi:hypothetical protein